MAVSKIRFFIPVDSEYVSNAVRFYSKIFGVRSENEGHSSKLELHECIIVVTSRHQDLGVTILELLSNSEVANSIIKNSYRFAEEEISPNEFRRGVIAKRRDPFGVIWVIREELSYTGPLSIEDVCALCRYSPLHYPAQCSEIRQWQAVDDNIKQTVGDYGRLSHEFQQIREGMRSYERIRELRGHPSAFKCFEELESMNGIFARLVICCFFNNELTTDPRPNHLNHLLGVAKQKYHQLLRYFPNPPENIEIWLSEYEKVRKARKEAADAIRQVVKRIRELRYANRDDLTKEEAYMNNVCYSKVSEWRLQNSTV